MAEAVLAADSLEKRYGDVTALGGVDLAVRPGEVFALVGPNGAGKTTLVRCLSGTTSPDAGRATLLGDDPSAADRNRIGLLPQDFAPPDRLTARELLAYYAGLYDGARPVEAVLDAVGMAGAADTRFKALSGGQRRRTLVGSAIVNDPDVLFLDEPTAGIDPAGRRTLWLLVEAFAAGGTTVFLTSHDMAEVERLADRVGVLVEGRLRAVGTPADLLAARGGESRLVVETDGPVEDVVESGLAGWPVEAADRGLRIEGVRAADVGEVIAALEAAGVAFDALTWREPDLESVYLDLTGEGPGAEGDLA